MVRPLSGFSPTALPAPNLWTPTPLPLIASKGITRVCLNFETTGLQWFDGDRPISAAIDYPSDDPSGFTTEYHSWGHSSGNESPDAFRDWAQHELRGVQITNINTRFDVHMGRVFGIDFEALGCPVSDVGHYAALLDDHRQRSNLDALIADIVQPDVVVPRLDESRMSAYPAGLVAPRAMYNVQMVRRLRDIMLPQLAEQELNKVRDLEDKLIYVVCEMEKNGSPIDIEKLERWEKRSEQQVAELQNRIAKLTGWSVQTDLFGSASGYLNPDSPKEMEKLFTQLGLPIARTESGRPSFSGAVLDRIDHPVIELIRQLNRLLDLRAKYLVGDLKRIGRDGILRYALHQLRAVKDDSTGSGEAGTVTGRFSSTEITSGVGVNIQQRIKVAKQRTAWGFDEDDTTHDDEIYLIRELHVPANGKWLSADAMQVEYRLFANEVNSPRINEAYDKDPLVSFHRLMHAQLKQWKPELTYRRMKDVNFAKIYSAGPKKMALMLGFITHEQFVMLTDTKARYSHPLLTEIMDILRIYDKEIPEAGPLIKKASDIARERGFIKSILGRRQRFPNGFRLHKALNSRIQPSAADIMKVKLVRLHEERRKTGFVLRFTVHDECDGDSPDDRCTEMVTEILNQQDFPFRIPILWEVGTGVNWAACG